MNVALEWFEVSQASDTGRWRKIASMLAGNANNHGFSGSGWNEDIEGACAEKAVAKTLNLYWDGGIGTYKAGDVGPYQVRWTPSPNNSLIIREQDADEAVFILVTGLCPNYDVHGWISGKEGKDIRWYRDPCGRPPAYFVPQMALHPLNTLPK